MNKIESKASACVNCITKNCQVGCPLQNDIPEFIQCIQKKEYKDAFECLSKTTVLPFICGMVCPSETQCQASCVKRISYEPVCINELEAFIGEESLKNNWNLPKINKIKGKKVAVIGGGPAGLTCAGFLSRYGVSVTIYEKHDYLGGLLVHGIPEFRLDKEKVNLSIEKILDSGVKVKYNQELGRNLSIKELLTKYDKVFIGIGSNTSIKIKLENDTLKNVYYGNEVLESKLEIDYKDKDVSIYGGGNTAMDLAEIAKRSGAKRVTIIYRRNESSMPALKSEIKRVKELGIDFLLQTSIVSILGDKKVERLEVIKNEIKDIDGDGKADIAPIEGSNYYLWTDLLIMALGSKVEEEALKNSRLKLTLNHKIEIDEEGHTSRKNVYAGGDVTETRSTVSWASRSGRNAAYQIFSDFSLNK